MLQIQRQWSIADKQIDLQCWNWKSIPKCGSTIIVKRLKDSFQSLEMSRIRPPNRHVRKDIQESMSHEGPLILLFTFIDFFFFN